MINSSKPNIHDPRSIESIVERFEAAWRQGGRPAIEEYLGPDERHGPLLVELVHSDLELRLKRGEPALVEAYLRRFPGLAADRGVVWDLIRRELVLRTRRGASPIDELRWRFPEFAEELSVEAAELALASTDRKPIADRATEAYASRPGDDSQNALAASQRAERHGDYELIRKLGEGGMGEVHLARQISLGRLVALKRVLPRGGLGDADAARLQAEAQAAAALDHPGIVGIYEVGEHEGRPYISQAYVEGTTLAERVAERPLPARQAVEIVRQVAEAVHYAHERGVIHRDIKPGNILIDSQGRPRIADFGLAKRFEPVAVEGAAVDAKLTGAAGTPAYMPPEQASPGAQPFGPAADIYGLGATLYHLLTGRPPFQAADWEEIRRQILQLDPVAPRALNPEVPRDLETIVLKCLAKAPGLRYATALVLAEDLGRFERGEPVVARPVGPAARLWRWCKRKPISAAFAAAATLLLLVLGIGGPVVAVRESRLREKRTLAEVESRKAVEEFYIRVSEDRLLKEPGMQQLRRDLLAQARDFYQGFLRTHGDEAALGPDVARVQLLLGEILDELGPTSDALAAYDAARVAYEGLNRDEPASDTWKWQLALCHERIGQIRSNDAGMIDSALNSFRESRTLLRELRSRLPDDVDVADQLAINYSRVADVYRIKSDRAGAEAELDLCLSLRRELVEKHPDDLDLRVNLAGALGTLAELKAVDQAIALHTEALEIWQDTVRRDHDSTFSAQGLAGCLTSLGVSYRNAGNWDDAERSLRQAVETCERLHDENPDVRQIQYHLIEACDQLAFVLQQLFNDEQGERGRLDEALSLSERAVALQRTLVEANPANVGYRDYLATILNMLALIERDLGKLDASLETYGEALRIHEELIAADPSRTGLRYNQGITYANLGRTHRRRGAWDDVLDAHGRARDIYQELLAIDPQDDQFRRMLREQHFIVAEAQINLRQAQPALDSLARCSELDDGTRAASIAALRPLCLAQLGDYQRADDEAATLLGRGNLARDSGRYLAQALALVSAAVRDDPSKAPEGRRFLADESAAKAIGILSELYPSRETFFAEMTEDPWLKELAEWVAHFERDPTLRMYLAWNAQIGNSSDYEAMLADLEEKRRKSSGKSVVLFEYATGAAGLAMSVTSSETPPSDGQAASIRERCEDLAIAMLQDAIATGFDDFRGIQSEPRFEPLLEHPGFQALIPPAENTWFGPEALEWLKAGIAPSTALHGG